MMVFHLSRSWELELYNEDHPQAFVQWRLRELADIRALVQQSYAKVVLFKPILDTHLACQLLSNFPNALLLFAFRHYPPVITSSIRRFGPESWPKRVSLWMQDDFGEFAAAPPPNQTRQAIRQLWWPALNSESAIALYWLFYNRLYYDLELDHDPRVKLVSYDRLVSSPQSEFSALCDFLSISFRPEMVEDVFVSPGAGERPVDIQPEIRSACDHLWQRLTEDASRQP